MDYRKKAEEFIKGWDVNQWPDESEALIQDLIQVFQQVATEARESALEEAAKVADTYPLRDPGEDGNGYWAAEEIGKSIRSLKSTPKSEEGK